MSTQALRSGVSLLARIPGVAIVLVLLIIGFTLANPKFATPGNLANLLVQSTLLTLLALPMTLVIMTEGLDLSIGAVLTLASIALALTVVGTGSAALGVLAGLGVGLGFGLLNGWLVTALNLPPFIATLGTLGIAQGLSLVVTDGQSVVGIPPAIERVYSSTLLGIPVPIVLAALVYGIVHLLLYHTRFGVAVFALGGNREALRLAGVSDRAMLVGVYALSGLIAGFAALLMTARLNAAHPTAGLGLEFDAIAAVAVGGTSFERGNGWLFGSLVGVLAVGVLRNGLNLVAVPSSTQVACIGLLVILALFIDALRSRA
ncbi:MAG: ABC transporter permease [Rhodoplanes sp.]|jgi:ribose transport system permease protein